MLELLIIPFTCIIFYFVKTIKFNMAYNMVPVYPGWLPLVGHSYLLLGHNLENLWTLSVKMLRELLALGGVARFFLGSYLVIFVADPDDADVILNKCLDRNVLYKLGKPWFGDGLITADVPTWKTHRKVLNQSFTHKALVGFTGVFNRQAKQLLTNIEPRVGKPFDPERVLIKNDLQSISKTTTGIELDADTALFNDYTYAAHNFLYVLIYKSVSFCFNGITLPSITNKYDYITAKFHNLASTLLNMRKAELVEVAEEINSTDNIRPIMDKMLMMSRHDNLFTDEEVKSELDLILFAGHDTTASTIHYALLLLGSHLEVQEKAYEEVREVFGDFERDLDNVDLTKLIYIQCILKETMRLYPVGPVILRTSSTDIQLKNYTIRAGTPLGICIWAIHRHTLWGEDADAFRPERWLDPEKATAFSKAFYAFSAGKRGCIGKSYAMLSMKITLAHFIRKYRVKSDLSKLRLKIKALLKPSSGQEITIELRN